MAKTETKEEVKETKPKMTPRELYWYERGFKYVGTDTKHDTGNMTNTEQGKVNDIRSIDILSHVEEGRFYFSDKKIKDGKPYAPGFSKLLDRDCKNRMIQIKEAPN